MFPIVRPELLAIPQECLTCDLERAVSVIKSCEKVSLRIIADRHVAIWGHDRLIMSDGYQLGFSGPQPLDKALYAIVSHQTFTLFGSFPSSRFFVGFAFPKREEPFRMVSRCQIEEPAPLRLRLHTHKELGDDWFLKLEGVFRKWFLVASTTGFHDEVLVCPRISMDRFSAPAQDPLPRQLGLEIQMPEASEVFFPWLELFFMLRSEFPKAMRVSLEFTHLSSTELLGKG
jgi:hypothetical protein